MAMLKKFGFFFFIFIFAWFPSLPIYSDTPVFPFPEYLTIEATELPNTLKKESGNLSDEEINRSLHRAEEAFAHKEWEVASSEYSRVLGKHPDKRDLWLRLSIATQRKNPNNSYQWDQLAKKAAVRAYQLASTPEEKAAALLVYGDSFNPSDDFQYPQYYQAIEAAYALTDVAQLRSEHKDLQDIALFRYIQPRVNVDNTPASACFSFSTPLKTENIQVADYVTVTPKVEGMIKASGREICISPLAFGGNYDVLIKAGLKDIFGEKLNQDLKLSIKVRDQDSRLSFKTSAYVLRKEENTHVPLSGTNVDTVGIKILRVPEANLSSVVGQSKEFLNKLWDYRITQIGNEVGELLYEGEMDFSKEKNKTVTKQIPFFKVVKEALPGAYIVQAEEKNAVLGNKATATQWLIVSDLGLTTFTERDGGIWVNVRSLKSADVLSDVELRLLANNNTVLDSQKTNKEGMAYFAPNVTNGKGGNRPLMVLAYDTKEDFSFLALDTVAFDFSDRGVSGRSLSSSFDAFLYTEQGVYRPGSSVHVNALLRDNKGEVITSKLPLTFNVIRSDETLVKSVTLTGNELGLYELKIPLVNTARLGQWAVLAYVDPKKDPVGRVTFSVEDFVPSRVVVQLKANRDFLSETEATEVDVTGQYLFGSPAAGVSGETSLTLRPRENPYPQYPGFTFGLVTDSFQNIQTFNSLNALNKEGKGTFTLQLEKLPQTSLPLEGVIRVTLADKGGRPEIGTLTLPVATQKNAIGIKPFFKEGTVSENEQEAKFEIIALDKQGQPIENANVSYEFFEENIQYSWYRLDQYSAWQYKALIDDKFLQNGTLSINKPINESTNKPMNESTDKSMSQGGRTVLSVPVKQWGQYRLEIKDQHSGAATSIRFQKGWVDQDQTNGTPDKIRLILEKDKVLPGETIEIEVESPFEGQALLTLANDKVLETRNIMINKNGNRIKLKANEQWGVGVYCMISAVRPLATDKGILKGLFGGERQETASCLPKRAVGLTWIGIDPKLRTLHVNFDLPKEVKPRQTIDIPLTILKHDGKPASHVQLTFAAVDEGILKLTDFNTPDPKDYFLGKRMLGVEQRDLYGKLIDPISGEMGELRQGGDSGMLSRNMQALSKRSFKVVSLYKGLVIPDKAGKAKVQIELPDFNGSLRLMAIAFDEKSYGTGTSTLMVRDPIVVESVLPRFLAPGDKSNVSLSLHNISAPAGKYTVQLKTEGPLSIAAEKSHTVTLEKQGVQSFRVPFEASKVGEGKVIVSVMGEGLNIITSNDISIRSPAPYTRWTTSHLLKSQESFKLIHDVKDVVSDASEAMLSINSRLPWDTYSLSKQLLQYPYGCVEQTTSRGMGALFGGKRSADQVNQVLALLSEKQSSSGGYYLWTLSPNGNGEGNGGDLFLTSYVMDYYLEAKLANFEVPKFTVERGLEWLKQTLERKNKFTADELSGASYALYVLTKANQLETGSLRYFTDTYFEQINNPLSRAMLGTALAMKGESERADKAFKALFTVPNDGKMTVGPMGSSLRNQAGILALSLAALKANAGLTSASTWVESATDYIQKALHAEKGTKAVQENGVQRLSTQELAWILLASNGLNQSSTSLPIQMMLNGKRSYSSNEKVLQIPISAKELTQGIELSNPTKQNVWVNASLSTLLNTPPGAERNGVELEVSYYDLTGKKLDPHHVVSGTQIVAVISGSQENTRAHQLLIVDLLPAGFEIESVKAFQDAEVFQWLPELTKPAYAEARDDRFIAALDIDENNARFKIAYLVRAVTPGTYIKPGVFAEDMYAPNFFAQNASEIVEISPP